LLRLGPVLLMRIERANPSDLPAVGTLLAAAGLPLDGVAAAFQTGVVARESDAIVGAAAVERYGEAGLLRSVAVAPGERGTGLGRDLVEAAEQLARNEGIATMYLLTDTAIDWFPRLGYVPVPRDEAEAAVGASIEFTLSCAVTGVAMRRDLG
jgi:amino-acid N-acetyltransferase